MPKRKSGRSRRQYSEELKAEAVQMLLDGHSAKSVASRLGLSGANVLYRWKANLLSASGPAATALETRAGLDAHQVMDLLDVIASKRLGDGGPGEGSERADLDEAVRRQLEALGYIDE